jgi:hypothetical protein
MTDNDIAVAFPHIDFPTAEHADFAGLTQIF